MDDDPAMNDPAVGSVPPSMGGSIPPDPPEPGPHISSPLLPPSLPLTMNFDLPPSIPLSPLLPHPSVFSPTLPHSFPNLDTLPPLDASSQPPPSPPPQNLTHSPPHSPPSRHSPSPPPRPARSTHRRPLPPASRFTPTESLHKITLAPLAQFLASLSSPAHLLKLSDILEQYRTPMAYQRIDVRLVTSSELPPGSPMVDLAALTAGTTGPAGVTGPTGVVGAARVVGPDGLKVGVPVLMTDAELEGAREKVREAWRRERGSPVIEAVEEVFQAETNGDAAEVVTLQDSQIALAIVNSTAAETTTVETMSMAIDVAPDMVETLASLHDQVDFDERSTHDPTPSLTHEPHTPADANASNPSTPSTTYPFPPSPIAFDTHPPPPTGPVRRIRELRLDLRTLDAAALFALETWRRQVMGLPKLGMAKPDSKWYQSESEGEGEEDEVDVEVEVVGRMESGQPKKGGEKVKERKEGEGKEQEEGKEGKKAKAVKTVEEVKEVTRLRELAMAPGRDMPSEGESEIEPMSESEDEVTIQPETRPSGVANSLTAKPTNQTDEDILTALIGAAHATEFDASAVDLGMDMDDHDANADYHDPPSPDIVLPDGYNVQDEDDPDFEPTPPPESRLGPAPKAVPKARRNGEVTVLVTVPKRRGRPPKNRDSLGSASEPVEINQATGAFDTPRTQGSGSAVSKWSRKRRGDETSTPTPTKAGKKRKRGRVSFANNDEVVEFSPRKDHDHYARYHDDNDNEGDDKHDHDHEHEHEHEHGGVEDTGAAGGGQRPKCRVSVVIPLKRRTTKSLPRSKAVKPGLDLASDEAQMTTTTTRDIESIPVESSTTEVGEGSGADAVNESLLASNDIEMDEPEGIADSVAPLVMIETVGAEAAKETVVVGVASQPEVDEVEEEVMGDDSGPTPDELIDELNSDGEDDWSFLRAF